MGYRVYYEELSEITKQVDELCQKWLDSFENLNSKSNVVADTKYFKGSTATNISNYIKEVHGSLITAISTAIINYNMAHGDYYSGYLTSVDGGAGAHAGDHAYNTLIQEELDDGGVVVSRFDKFISIADSTYNEVERVRRSISDLISLDPAKGEPLLEALDQAKQIALTTNDKVVQYESGRTGDLDDFDAALSEVKSIIYNQLSNKRIAVSQYQSGAVVTMCDYSKLGEAISGMSEDIEKMQDGYINSQAAFSDIEEYKDYEIRQEQAKWVKIGVGVVAAIGMAALTVCTGGVAAVVGCAAFGAVKGAVTVVADVYAEKGQGTNFFSNVTSKSFYEKWDSKDWLNLGTSAVKGGVEGAFYAISAASAGTCIKQPLQVATQKMKNKAIETAIDSGLDTIQNVGEAIIDRKPGEEIHTIIADGIWDGIWDGGKRVLTESVAAGVSGYVGAEFKINTSEKGFLQKTGETFAEKASGTAAKTFTGTTWDVGEALITDKTEDIDSIIRDSAVEFRNDLVKDAKDSLIKQASSGMSKGINTSNNVVNAGKDILVNSAMGTVSDVSDKMIDGFVADENVDWEEVKEDLGRTFVDNVGDSVAEKIEDDGKRRKLYKENTVNGKVEVINFGTSTDGFLRKDVEAAYEVAGKGSYKNMTVEQILGVTEGTDVSLENANVYEVNASEIRDTAKDTTIDERYKKEKTNATQTTISYETVIDRIKDK